MARLRVPAVVVVASLLAALGETTATVSPATTPWPLGSCLLPNGTVIGPGSTFNRFSDPCQPCRCVNGEFKCSLVHCVQLACQRGITLPGRCCPICLPTLTCATVLCAPPHICVEDEFRRFRCIDSCYPGRCSSNEVCLLMPVQCQSTPCYPAVNCSSDVSLPPTPPGRCVLPNGTIISNGTTINGLNPCILCKCTDGVFACNTIRCTLQNCAITVRRPGQCCPLCIPRGVTCATVLCAPPHRCVDNQFGRATCIDYCYSGRCASGQVCQLVATQCSASPCYPVVQCTSEVLPTTILTVAMPTCKQGEEFRHCGTACEPSCTRPNPLVCTLQCVVNVCQCRSGYVRSSNGLCVSPQLCAPTPPPSCGPNENFRQCGTACEPTCAQPHPPDCACRCIENTCECKRGFLRSPDGQCVQPASCQQATSQGSSRLRRALLSYAEAEMASSVSMVKMLSAGARSWSDCRITMELAINMLYVLVVAASNSIVL